PVPQGDIQAAEAHVVILPQRTLEVVIDLFALMRVASDQVRSQRQGLPERHLRATPQRHILAAPAVLSAHYASVLGEPEPAAGQIDDIESAAVPAEIGQLESKFVDFDSIDPAHGNLAGCARK